MVGFKDRTIGKQFQWLENSCRLHTENDTCRTSHGVQMKSFSGGQRPVYK